jgi:hypothetical protein
VANETVTIDKVLLQAVFDVAVGSMDFGSGFLCDEDVEHLRAAAVVLGVDPLVGTPTNFVCKYTGEHKWADELPAPQAEWYAKTFPNVRVCVTCRRQVPLQGTDSGTRI